VTWMSRALASVAAVALAALTVLVGSTPAWAHNELRASSPTSGARLAAPPTQVVLDFAERLDPKYTRISVVDAGKVSVVTDPPTVKGTRAVQPLAVRATGDYTVAFRVVSVDGHPVQGSVKFRVTAVPAATATPAATASTSPSPPAGTGSPAVSVAAVPVADEDSGAAGPLVVAGLAAVAVTGLAAAGTLLLRRRRDRITPA
jgi:copper resistance protein C